jgi:hypothetical protein
VAAAFSSFCTHQGDPEMHIIAHQATGQYPMLPANPWLQLAIVVGLTVIGTIVVVRGLHY